MMKKEIPVLFSDKADCCGCGACLNSCPAKAITLSKDEYGFVYPEINPEKCIRCGKCKRVCAFQNITETNQPLVTFAAVSKNSSQAQKSASGGIFATVAENFLCNGGFVFGATFTENWNVHHKCIDNLRNLPQLQGSKYVQSDILDTYSQAKQLLENNRKVLFSGTPCQIAGLKGFLGKDYDNLLTIDIICHGVPSQKIWQSYLDFMKRKYHGDIRYLTFRDKQIGWGINGKMSFAAENGREKNVVLWQSGTSYLYYFIHGWLYRENCYQCKYASEHRPADITLGDYWGIEKQHPEYLDDASGWNESKGISVIIANTPKGKQFIEQARNSIDLKSSSFEKASYANGQLRHPCEKGKRDEILELYARQGWDALEKRFVKKTGLRKHSSRIKSFIPRKLKRWLKSRM